jgi:hypothetical protein
MCFKKAKSITAVISPSTLPWVWIGTSDETFTEVVNQKLTYGHIDHKFLEGVTGIKTTTWRYIDSKTLEYRDFPLSGIVIDEPSPVSNSK